MSIHDQKPLQKPFAQRTALHLVAGFIRRQPSDLTDARFLTAAQKMSELEAARATRRGRLEYNTKVTPRTEQALRGLAIREAAGRKKIERLRQA